MCKNCAGVKITQRMQINGCFIRDWSSCTMVEAASSESQGKRRLLYAHTPKCVLLIKLVNICKFTYKAT